jgi:hypothetical protein
MIAEGRALLRPVSVDVRKSRRAFASSRAYFFAPSNDAATTETAYDRSSPFVTRNTRSCRQRLRRASFPGAGKR